MLEKHIIFLISNIFIFFFNIANLRPYNLSADKQQTGIIEEQQVQQQQRETITTSTPPIIQAASVNFGPKYSPEIHIDLLLTDNQHNFFLIFLDL